MMTFKNRLLRCSFLCAAALTGLLLDADVASAKDLWEFSPSLRGSAGKDAFKFTAVATAGSGGAAPPQTCCPGNHTGASPHPGHGTTDIVHEFWTKLQVKGSWVRQAYDWLISPAGFGTPYDHHWSGGDFKKVGTAYYPGVSGSKPTTPPAYWAKRIHEEYWGRHGNKTNRNGNDYFVCSLLMGGGACLGDYCIKAWPANRGTSSSAGVMQLSKKAFSCQNWKALFSVTDEWPKGRFAATTPDIEFSSYVRVDEEPAGSVYCGGMGLNEKLTFQLRFYHDESTDASKVNLTVGVDIKAVTVAVSIPIGKDGTASVDVFPPLNESAVQAVRAQTAICSSVCSQ